MSYNKVILIGNLGKDPEVRHLENGTSVANFTLATSESFKDRNGERQKRTEWHNIEVWSGLAQVAEKYLTKGKQVCVEGRIRTDSWEDKESGLTKYRTKIVANNMVMLGSKSDGSSAPAASNTSNNMAASQDAGQQAPPTSSTEGNVDVSSTEQTDDLPF